MIDRKQKLSVHFSLEELTHTDYGKPGDNEPPLEAITNLITICEDWLEELRFRYNMLYVLHFLEDYDTSENVEGIIICLTST